MTAEVVERPLPSQDERVMAALAHAAILFPFAGVIAPIIIWVLQKDKSPYVAVQALQAVVYQIVLIVLWFVGMACYLGSIFSLVPAMVVIGEANMPDRVGMAFPFLILGIMGFLFLVMFLFIIYGLIAAVMALQGKDFRYALIGSRLERYLERS